MSEKRNSSLDRRVTAYPPPTTHKNLVNLAEKQGRSVSGIINDALKEYLKKETPNK